MSNRRETMDDVRYERESDNPGLALVAGLFVFLLVIGLIGWHTRPAPVVYSHSCRRYELDNEEDEWYEGFESGNTSPSPKQPAVKALVKAGTGLKADKNLNKASQNAIKAAIAKRINKRVASPKGKPTTKTMAKPAAAKPSASPPNAQKSEGYQETKTKKPTLDVKPVMVTSIS